MARRCFYSFHYKPDNWRAGQVRSLGKIDGNEPVSDNDWEKVKKGGSAAIKKWIADQLKGRSCTVVLIGTNTANRKWINHEIVESWNNGKGVVGVRIHGLKNKIGYVSTRGKNPFQFIDHNPSGKKLSSIAECYDPKGSNSKERYNWISRNLATIVEKAVKIRKAN